MKDTQPIYNQFRMYVYFVACLPCRLLLVFLALYYKKQVDRIRWVGYCIAAAFLLLFFTGWRKVGLETAMSHEKIWWNSLRPLHAACFALFAFSGHWAFLLADFAIGLAVGVLKAVGKIKVEKLS